MSSKNSTVTSGGLFEFCIYFSLGIIDLNLNGIVLSIVSNLFNSP